MRNSSMHNRRFVFAFRAWRRKSVIIIVRRQVRHACMRVNVNQAARPIYAHSMAASMPKYHLSFDGI